MLINWEILPEIEVQVLGFENDPRVTYVFVIRQKKKNTFRGIAEFLQVVLKTVWM